MLIDTIEIVGFRNFKKSIIKFNNSSLIIGSNDVGKTNLIYAIRLLLDKSLSESDIEPKETDYHINSDGSIDNFFSITLSFIDVKEDAARSILKGHISDDNKTIFKFIADDSMDYQIYVGPNEDELEQVTSRFYLKYINLRYVKSRRDLKKFIDTEKNNY